MLLKLSALVVVASASVFCLAAPPVGGSGLAARDSYAGRYHVRSLHEDDELTILRSR